MDAIGHGLMAAVLVLVAIRMWVLQESEFVLILLSMIVVLSWYAFAG